MKKNVIRLFAAILALSCTLILSACSGGGESSSSTTSTGSSVSSTVEDSSSQSSESSAAEDSSVLESSSETSSQQDATGVGLYSSMEEFVNSEEIQSQLAAMNTEDMGVTITGEGNKLTYIYTFTESLEGVDMESAKASLESALDTQASTFESIASSLTQAVAVENPVVVVTYQDNQGNVIYSREFAAQ